MFKPKFFKKNNLFLIFITFITITLMTMSQAQVLNSVSTDQEGCLAKVNVGNGIFNNNVYCTGCTDPRVIVEKKVDPETIAMNPNIELDKTTKITITLTIKNYSSLPIKGSIWDAISGTNIELVEDISGTIYNTNTMDYFSLIKPTNDEFQKIDEIVPSTKLRKYLENTHYESISNASPKKNLVMQINGIESSEKLLNGKFQITDSEIEVIPPESVEYPWFFLDKQLERMDGTSYKNYNHLLKWDVNIDKCKLEDGICTNPTIHKISYTVKPLQKGTVKLGRSFFEYSNSITENFEIELLNTINPIIKAPGETELVNLLINNSSPESISNFSITVFGDLGYRNWISFPGREKKCNSLDHEATNINTWLNPNESITIPVKITVPENDYERTDTGLYVGYINVCINDADNDVDNKLFQTGRSQNCKHVPLVVMVERPADYPPAIDLGYTNHIADDCLPCIDKITPTEETCGTCSLQQKVIDVLSMPIEGVELEVKYLDVNLTPVIDHYITNSNGIAIKLNGDGNVTYPYGESLNCAHTLTVSKSDPINPNMENITSHTYNRQLLSCTPTDTVIGYKPLEILIEAPDTLAAVGAYNMVVSANIPIFDVIYTQSTQGLYTTVYDGTIVPPQPPNLNGTCGDSIVNTENGEECDPPGSFGNWRVSDSSGYSYLLCGNDCLFHPQQTVITHNSCAEIGYAAGKCNDYKTQYAIVLEDEIVPNIYAPEVGEGTEGCLDWQNCTQPPCNAPWANEFTCDSSYGYRPPTILRLFTDISELKIISDSGNTIDTANCSASGCSTAYFPKMTNSQKISNQLNTYKRLECKNCFIQPGSTQTPLDLWDSTKGDVAGEALLKPNEALIEYKLLTPECINTKNAYYSTCTKISNKIIYRKWKSSWWFLHKKYGKYNRGNNWYSGGNSGGYGGHNGGVGYGVSDTGYGGNYGNSNWGNIGWGWENNINNKKNNENNDTDNNRTRQCGSGDDGCCYPISDSTCDPDCAGLGFCEIKPCMDYFNSQAEAEACYENVKSINCSTDPDCQTDISWNPPEITVVGTNVVKMTLNETLVVNNTPFDKPVKISAHNTVSDQPKEMWARLTMVWQDGNRSDTKKYVTIDPYTETEPEHQKEMKLGIGNVGVGQEFSVKFLPYSPNTNDLGSLPTKVMLTAEVFEGVCNPNLPESLTNCYKGYRNEEGISGLGLGVPTDVYYGTLGKVEAPIVVTNSALLNISFVKDMNKDGIDDVLQQINKGELIDIGVKVTNQGGSPAPNTFVQISNRCMQNTNTVVLDDGDCFGSCTEFQKTETTWKHITETMEKLELALEQPSRMELGTLAPTQTATAIFTMKANKGQDLEYVYQCFEANAENLSIGTLSNGSSTLYNGLDNVEGVPHNIYFRNIKAGNYSIFISPKVFSIGNLDTSYGNAQISAPFRISNTTSAYLKNITATCSGTICNSGILSINGHYFNEENQSLIIGNIAAGGTAPIHIELKATPSTIEGTYTGTITIEGTLNSGDVVFSGINIEKNENGTIEFKGINGNQIQKNTLNFSGLTKNFNKQSTEFIGLSGIDSSSVDSIVNFEGGENSLSINSFDIIKPNNFTLKNPNTKENLSSIEIVAPILKETSFPILVKNESQSSSYTLNLKTSNARIVSFRDQAGIEPINELLLGIGEEKIVNLVITPPYGSRSIKYLYYATFEKNANMKINLPILINVPVNLDAIPLKISRIILRGEKSCTIAPETDISGNCIQENPNITTLVNYSRWPTQITLNYNETWVQTTRQNKLITLNGYDSDIIDFNLTVPNDIPPGEYLEKLGLNSNKNVLIYIHVPNDIKLLKETEQGNEIVRGIVKSSFSGTTISEVINVASSINQTATIEYKGIGDYGNKTLPKEWVQINKTDLTMNGADCHNFACIDTFNINITIPKGQPPASYNGMITINANNNINKIYITIFVMQEPKPVTYRSYEYNTVKEKYVTQQRSITAPVHITYKNEPPKCGNGSCDANETQSICPSDCGSTGGVTCGNSVCEENLGETTQTCSFDCPTPIKNYCGNGKCEDPDETTINCPSDCGSTGGTDCGNSICGPGENPDNCNIDCINPNDTNVIANPIIIQTRPTYFVGQIYDGTVDYTNIKIENNSPVDTVTFTVDYEEYGQGLPRSWLRINRGNTEYIDILENYSDEFNLLAKNEINIPNELANKVNETNMGLEIEVPLHTSPGVYSGKFLIKSEVWSGGTKGSGIRIFYNEDIFPILIKVPERIIVSKNQINTTVPDGTTSSSQSFSITNYGGKIDLENVVLSVDKVGQNPIEPNWINFSDNNFTVRNGVENAKTVNFTITVPEGKSFGVTSGMIRITGTLAKLNDYKNYIMVFVTTPKRLAVNCSNLDNVSCSTNRVNISVPTDYVINGGSIPVNFSINNTQEGSSINVSSKYTETGENFWDDGNVYIGSKKQSEGSFITTTPINAKSSQNVQMNIQIPIGTEPKNYTGKVEFEYQMEKITFLISISVPFQYTFNFNQTETEVFDGIPTKIGSITTTVTNRDTSAILSITNNGKSSTVSPFWFNMNQPIKWLIHNTDDTLITDLNVTVPATNRTTTKTYDGYILLVLTATGTQERIPFSIKVKNSINPIPLALNFTVGDGGLITAAVGLRNESPNPLNIFQSDYVEFSPIGGKTINADWVISKPANTDYSVAGSNTEEKITVNKNIIFKAPLSNAVNYDSYDYSGIYTGNLYISGKINDQPYFYNIPTSINIPNSMVVSPKLSTVANRYDGETISLPPFTIKNQSAVAIDELEFNILETGTNTINANWISGSFDSTTIPGCIDQNDCNATKLRLNVTLPVDTAPGTYNAEVLINGTKTKDNETKNVLSKVQIEVKIIERFAIKNNQLPITFITPSGTGDSYTCNGELKPKTGGTACNPELSCGDIGFDENCNPWGTEVTNSFIVENRGTNVTLICNLQKQQTGSIPAEIDWITIVDENSTPISSFTVAPKANTGDATVEKIINVKAQVPQIPRGAYTASITVSCYGNDITKSRTQTVNTIISTPLAWGVSPPAADPPTTPNWQSNTFSFNYPPLNEGDPLFQPFTTKSNNEATGVVVTLLDPPSGKSAKNWLSLDRTNLILPKGGSTIVKISGNAPIDSEGNYSAIVQFKTTLTNEIKKRTINFLVGTSLTLTKTEIITTATEGVETALNNAFEIINGTPETFHTITYSVLGSSSNGTLPLQQDWFVFSNGTGWTGNTLTGGATGQVNVLITPPEKTVSGIYTGQLTVTTKRNVIVNGITNTITKSKTIPVTVTVENTLSIDKTAIIKTIDEGTTGATEVVTITNNSVVSDVSITSINKTGTWSSNWVTVTPIPQVIGSETSQQFTININIPVDAQSGEYSGTLTFVSDKGESKTVNLIIRVNTSVVFDIC